MPKHHTVVVDNGASSIKLGIVGRGDTVPRIIPNAIIRSKGDKTTYFEQEFEQCKDFSSLNYRLPFERVCISPLWMFLVRDKVFTATIGLPCRLGRAEGDMGWSIH